MSESGRNTVQSVVRAFEILEVMASVDDDSGISEIAAQTGLPLPTIHRILHTLADGGYVYQTANRRYALGARLISLSRHARGSLGTSLRPLLAEVVDKTHESANVAMAERDRARYVAHVPSSLTMRMFTQVGTEAQMHATGVGKAILSTMSDDEVVALLRRTGMAAVTAHTITDIDTMRRELAVVRERGYAIDDEEQEIGVVCVAVPVPGSALAVSISGPQSRMTARAVAAAVPVLTDVAERISTGPLKNHR